MSPFMFMLPLRPLFTWPIVLLALAILAIPSLKADMARVQENQRSFATPEEARQALVMAAETNDQTEMLALFGPELKELLSGDAKQDALEFAAFAKLIAQYSHWVQKNDDRLILNIGAENWPFPIPLVKRGKVWVFNTPEAKDEIINRRIGEDELNAMGVCRAYLAAQREYACEDHIGDGILRFAQKVRSSPDKRDGLYWAATPDEEQSPLGPFISEVQAEGYGGKTAQGETQPFKGYHFKILTAQGQHAPGGAFSYLINGNMIAGFALVAYPAHWGESGVMTFAINQWGRIYQCNLGPGSTEIAREMTEFDPDPEWSDPDMNQSLLNAASAQDPLH